jgi:hypothetical protein
MGLSALALACVLAGASAAEVDRARAETAALASTALIPGDDIVNDFQVHDVHAADLDGDGVAEIVFRRTARCVGANFDCPNELVVLTALGPDDNRAIPQRPGLSPYWDASLAAVRDSGYADDTSVQIPGEIERIEVSGARVRVMFRVQENSPICLRRTYTNEGYVATTHCPAPGRHAWTYAWTPRDFRRVD